MKNPPHDRSIYRGYIGIFVPGSPLSSQGGEGFTLEIVKAKGKDKPLRQTYTPLPKSKLRKIFVKSIDIHLDEGMPMDRAVSEAMGRVNNPKKKKKSHGGGGKLGAKGLIDKCRRLYQIYFKKPTKTNLKKLSDFLDKMKDSSAESVKSERRRAMAFVRRESRHFLK